MKSGDRIELRVTPDRYVTVRYAGASGDFNPIHIDEEFAREVGLPGRILHGLWTMAQVARAASDAAGGPEHLRSLSVQFRGTGAIGEEIVVSGTIAAADGEGTGGEGTIAAADGEGTGGEGTGGEGTDGEFVARLEATQAGTKIIKNAVARLSTGD